MNTPAAIVTVSPKATRAILRAFRSVPGATLTVRRYKGRRDYVLSYDTPTRTRVLAALHTRDGELMIVPRAGEHWPFDKAADALDTLRRNLPNLIEQTPESMARLGEFTSASRYRLVTDTAPATQSEEFRALMLSNFANVK